MEVRFSNGGGDTYNLYDGGVTVLEGYIPKVGDFRKEDQVTDSIPLFLQASTAADMQTIKDTINYWLALAREQWETVNETRIFVEIKQASDADWRRSEMLGGRLQPVASSLNSHSQLKQEYLLMVERRNWWEWDEEEIPLSGDALSYSTGGVTVDNECIGIHMQGIDITGDPQMPAPIRIEIAPVSNSRFDDLYVALNTFAPYYAGLNHHILEGEDGLPLWLQSSTAARGGEYNALTWAGAALDDHYLITWALTGSRFAGRWFRVMARIKSSFTGTLRLRACLQHSGASYAAGTKPMSAAEEVLLESDSVWRLVDLGAIQIPSFVSSAAAADIELCIRGTNPDYPGELDVDFVFLAPVDGFYQARNAGTTNPEAWETIVVDSRLGKAYAIDSTSSGTVDTISTLTKFPMIWAGRDQWFVVAKQDDDSGGMDISDQFTVQAYYRPRRVTV